VTTSSAAQFTTLFDNAVMNQIERMRLRPLRRLTNRSRGEHLAGKGGSSTDFADYRDYVAGDDLRYVDWNIFARLRRPYIKQFQHEEEMHVALVVDASSSMLYEDKLLRAKQLAAAFGIMGLLNVERVSAYAIHSQEGQPWRLPPRSGRVRIRELLAFLEQIEGGGAVPIEKAIETMLRFHRGRGVVILLSDFMTFGDVSRPMNMLYSAGLEVWGLQVLSHSEINPEVQGDLRLVDCETGDTLDITNASELISVYNDQREWLQQQLDTMCRRRSGRFTAINTTDTLSEILFDTLCRKGWVLR